MTVRTIVVQSIVGTVMRHQRRKRQSGSCRCQMRVPRTLMAMVSSFLLMLLLASLPWGLPTDLCASVTTKLRVAVFTLSLTCHCHTRTHCLNEWQAYRTDLKSIQAIQSRSLYVHTLCRVLFGSYACACVGVGVGGCACACACACAHTLRHLCSSCVGAWPFASSCGSRNEPISLDTSSEERLASEGAAALSRSATNASIRSVNGCIGALHGTIQLAVIKAMSSS